MLERFMSDIKFPSGFLLYSSCPTDEGSDTKKEENAISTHLFRFAEVTNLYLKSHATMKINLMRSILDPG